MSDFVFTVFKGLYPIYLCFFAVDVWYRTTHRKWTVFDIILLVFFVIFELLASFQVTLFYGVLATSRRYLWVGLPLCLPFVANGLLRVYDFLKSGKTRLPLFAFLCIIIGGVNVYSAYSPVARPKRSMKKMAERSISREIALWISNDWKHAHFPLIEVFKCDQYQSGKRPLVQSDFERIGYLCGGQNFHDFFASKNMTPDYIVSQFPVCLPTYTLVKIVDSVNVYKCGGIRP